MHPGDRAAIEAQLHAYAAAWSENRAAALAAFWDAGSEPVYLAEEVDAPMLGWAAVRAYWAANEGLHAGVRLALRDLRVTPLAPDLASAVMAMDWAIAFRSGPSKGMGGDNRVAATLRRTAEGWRLVAWIEAPLAPITYMRRLYEARLPPGFAA